MSDACPLCVGIAVVTYTVLNQDRPAPHCSLCKREIPSRVVYEEARPSQRARQANADQGAAP